jgi:hypothetical protein
MNASDRGIGGNAVRTPLSRSTCACVPIGFALIRVSLGRDRADLPVALFTREREAYRRDRRWSLSDMGLLGGNWKKMAPLPVSRHF